MPSPPRILEKGTLHLVTSRVEEGLPFVCTLFMCLIIKSILARAQHLYDVQVCGVVFMGNHFHMLIVVRCPEATMRFIDRVKTETAHAVNRLLGRRKRTIWCDSYDATPILTVNKAVEKFVYLYTNPAQANLVHSIEHYPGYSSWHMLVSNETSETVPWVQRPMIDQLSSPLISRKQDVALTVQLTEAAREKHTFTLSPNAWLQCFGIPESESERYRQKIIDGVRQREEELSQSREHSVVGPEALRLQPIDKPYTPKKFSPRAWCISCDVGLRIEFIQKYKRLRAKAREVYQRWLEGDFSVPYPPELFAPRVPMPLVI